MKLRRKNKKWNQTTNQKDKETKTQVQGAKMGNLT